MPGPGPGSSQHSNRTSQSLGPTSAMIHSDARCNDTQPNWLALKTGNLEKNIHTLHQCHGTRRYIFSQKVHLSEGRQLVANHHANGNTIIININGLCSHAGRPHASLCFVFSDPRFTIQIYYDDLSLVTSHHCKITPGTWILPIAEDRYRIASPSA